MKNNPRMKTRKGRPGFRTPSSFRYRAHLKISKDKTQLGVRQAKS